MLTKEAWNAFLKTLEEPPPNTVFVLATTEPQKVMATIVDRCQRFDFQRPSLEQIAEVVRRVAAAEGIEIDDGAVALISRSASGSFRDALGTLDQLVAFGGEQGRDRRRGRAARRRRRRAALRRRPTRSDPETPPAALEAVDRLARSGRDPGQFARDLIAHLRQLLVARATGEVPESFTVTVAQPDRLGRAGGADRRGEADGRDRRALGRGRQHARGRRPPAQPRGGAAEGRPGPRSTPPRRRCCGGSRRSRARAAPAAGLRRAAGARRLQPRARPRRRSRDAGRPGARRGAPRRPVAKATETATAVAASIEIERVTELWPAVVDHVRELRVRDAVQPLRRRAAAGGGYRAVGAEGRLSRLRQVQQAQGRGAGQRRADGRVASRRSSASGCGPSTS